MTKISVRELAEIVRLIAQKSKDSGVTDFELSDDFFWEVDFEESLNLEAKPQNIGLGQYQDDFLELRELLDGVRPPGSFDFVRVGNLLRYLGSKYGF